MRARACAALFAGALAFGLALPVGMAHSVTAERGLNAYGAGHWSESAVLDTSQVEMPTPEPADDIEMIPVIVDEKGVEHHDCAVAPVDETTSVVACADGWTEES